VWESLVYLLRYIAVGELGELAPNPITRAYEKAFVLEGFFLKDSWDDKNMIY
jgi:hypothetical protein